MRARPCNDSLTILIPTKLVEEAAVEGANLVQSLLLMAPKSTRVLFLFIDKTTLRLNPTLQPKMGDG